MGSPQPKHRGDLVAPKAKPPARTTAGQMVTDLIAVAASLLESFPASFCLQGSATSESQGAARGVMCLIRS
jgi:hypothetical protein